MFKLLKSMSNIYLSLIMSLLMPTEDNIHFVLHIIEMKQVATALIGYRYSAALYLVFLFGFNAIQISSLCPSSFFSNNLAFLQINLLSTYHCMSCQTSIAMFILFPAPSYLFYSTCPYLDVPPFSSKIRWKIGL